MKIVFEILSATRGDVDGTKYSSVWAMGDEPKDDQNNTGYPPMKINCSFDLVDKLRGHLPSKLSCDVKMISGGGSKGSIFISDVDLSIKPK